MCGIVGLLRWDGFPEDGDDIVRRMAATLVHRGPDGEGYVRSGVCGLGFRRLAIVDLDAPSPPFPNETRTVWSIANGEIYNAPELRRQLQGRGHVLETEVDTEVIPHLYEEQGSDLVQSLNGMFALAAWDAPKQTLLLARDRAGEKPLFYWESNGELAFASELRALLVHPRVRREVDPIALRRYLLHDYFPSPHTPIRGVRKLTAGHLLVASRERTSVRRYWDLAEHFSGAAHSKRKTADLAEELDARIALAVERRRRSDVPVGLFLSGGIDSCTVLAHMTEQMGRGVPVFVIGNVDPDFDESTAARETSAFYRADYHPRMLRESDLADGLRRIAERFDEPLGDASILPTHLLALHARQNIKVVLSGEGADEMFAGYPTYLGHRLANGYGRLPAWVRRSLARQVPRWLPNTMGNVGLDYLFARFADGADRDLVERHHTWFGSVSPERQTDLLSHRVLEHLDGDDAFASARTRVVPGARSDLDRLLLTDFTMYLQDGLLTKVDRCTMLASLEGRAPFLDHELVEFVAGIPPALKISGFTTKAILRRAERKRLPPSVLSRRKRGFNIPFSRWILGGLASEIRRRFDPERVAARGLLSPAGVDRLLDEHFSRTADHRKPIFTLLSLDLWCDQVFGDRPVPIAAPGVPETALDTVAS